jgi:hypothetical protein
MAFELKDKISGRTEIVKVEIDLQGTRILRSPRGRLVFDVYDNGLVLLDLSGGADSLLRFLLLAFARLPFDPAPSLRWRDTLSRRLFMPRWLRAIADLWIVVVPEWSKLDVEYMMRREEGQVRLEGRAETWHATAILSLSGKGHTLEIEHEGVHTELTMTRLESDEHEDKE